MKTLYWSNLELYRDCPQKFLWSRGWQGIDLGGGIGKKKPLPKRKSEHNQLMGIVLAGFMENLYNHEWWRNPEDLVRKTKKYVEEEFERQVKKTYLTFGSSWDDSPPREELLQTCLDGAVGYLRTMKFNRLLGQYAKSEVDVKTEVGGIPIGGKADLILVQDGNLTILDGKNSKSVGKYTDPDQMRWYALCVYRAFGILPKRLAFVYFRYPHGTSRGDIQGEIPDGGWNGLVDVTYTKEDLDGLAQVAIEVSKGMHNEDFPAIPEPSKCKWCDYESVCPQRQDTKRSRNKKVSVLDYSLDGNVSDITL